jgi:DNA-binding MarR family transcriptional regulator
MSEAGIPEIVRHFIAQHIESAELLETLLLMHSEPTREWGPEEVARSIYTVPASATRRLEQLLEMGLATSNAAPNPRYRYAPSNEELRAQVDALADAYRKQRVAVINLIYSRPPDPLRSFADAFKLRRD